MKKHCITIYRAGSTPKKLLNNGPIQSSHTINNKEYLVTIAKDDYVLIYINDPNNGQQIGAYHLHLIK